VRATLSCSRRRDANAVGHAHDVLLEPPAIAAVGGEGLLVTDRLRHAVRLHRARVAVLGQRVQVPPRSVTQPVDQHAFGDPRQVAHRLDAEVGQLLVRRGADSPQSPTGSGCRNASSVPGSITSRPSGLRQVARDLGQHLRGGHTDRGGERQLLTDAAPEHRGDRGPRAEQPRRAGHVEERLVQ